MDVAVSPSIHIYVAKRLLTCKIATLDFSGSPRDSLLQL